MPEDNDKRPEEIPDEVKEDVSVMEMASLVAGMFKAFKAQGLSTSEAVALTMGLIKGQAEFGSPPLELGDL